MHRSDRSDRTQPGPLCALGIAGAADRFTGRRTQVYAPWSGPQHLASRQGPDILPATSRTPNKRLRTAPQGIKPVRQQAGSVSLRTNADAHTGVQK